LLQGTGDTSEEAIKNALNNGREDANEILKGIHSMEFVLAIEQDDLERMAAQIDN